VTRVPWKLVAVALYLGLTPDRLWSQPAYRQPDSARQCAVCHAEWVEAFRRPEAVVLIDRPDDDAAVDENTCLGCHDGSIADSRLRVWLDHGHQTGISPPPGMKVPAILPLTNGKVTCKTCHTAHASAGPETLATAVFLRVRNDASQLCRMCHTDHTKGPELGTHPIGGMPWSVPDELVAAGAEVGPDPKRLTCQTCHTPHGSREEHLLVMGTESNQLCLTCHKKLRPGLWRPELAREHPQNPTLSSQAQRDAIRDMGTKTGPGETLICLSCHKLHHGQAGRSMLADVQTESQLCLRCHPGRYDVVGTSHDLRISAPEERNRLGRSPQQSGPCGACHSFHHFARRPDPKPHDRTGLCTSCHQEGRCAGQATGLPFAHPSKLPTDALPDSLELPLFSSDDEDATKTLVCLTCHDPHKTRHDHFLRDKPDAVCASCHGEHTTSLGGGHDFVSRHPELRNGRNEPASETGNCGFCHGVHGGDDRALWVATETPPKQSDDLCLQCHREEGLASSTVAGALLHPTDLPTLDEAMTCMTCHDPHGGAGGEPSMLRTGGHPSPDTLCANCHDQVDTVTLSMHRPEVLEAHAHKTKVAWSATMCAPCHAVHARPGVKNVGAWTGPLGPDTVPADARLCMGCHGPNGGATTVAPVDHPAVALHNVVPTDSAGYLPLIDDKGLHDSSGKISCSTCHLPHGRSHDDPTPRTNGEKGRADLLQARKPMLRPYIAPNLCTSCHGFDGLRRFLYFHDPSKRATPTE
jgi:predicted CXXCH cytochrome family protein